MYKDFYISKLPTTIDRLYLTQTLPMTLDVEEEKMYFRYHTRKAISTDDVLYVLSLIYSYK